MRGAVIVAVTARGSWGSLEIARTYWRMVTGHVTAPRGEPGRPRGRGHCRFPSRGKSMQDYTKSAADLSAEERRFLLQIGEAGIVAYLPNDDDLIVRLLASGLVEGERLDNENSLLRLTP